MEMANVLSVIILLALVFISAFFRLHRLIWTTLIALALILISWFHALIMVALVIVWIVFLIVAAFANLHHLRQRYMVAPLLNRIKKQIPTISLTEQVAIDAGDTWWEKELFCGKPKWKTLFSIPKPTLSDEEQHFLDNQVETLCKMLNNWQIIHDDYDLPQEVWAYLKKERFFGMVVPKQYGGRGFSALAHSTVVTKIAGRSTSAAVTAMVPNSLGPAELLLHYGTEEQKNHYLPRLTDGTDIPCFALTAPDAGSDAGDITDTGIICYSEHDGERVLGIRLNWDKRYITLAPIATVLGLAIHLYDPDHLMGSITDIGITVCLIPTTHPGVELGTRHYPMRLAFLNGPTRGENVFIPLDWIIGGQAMAGHGWRMLMECLSIGRSISLPALATGSAKIIYRLTGAYARVRRQFNTAISNFEGIQEALGYIAGGMYQLEACRVMTAGAVDLKINPAIVSAIAKCHMTEIAREIIDYGMDVHAGHMIQTGPRNFLAPLHDAAPISITVEGANILTRNLIIFGQGAIRCHPYLLKEVALLAAPQLDIPQIDRVLMQHIGFFISTMLKTFAYSITGGLFIFATLKNKQVKKWQRQLTRMSASLAFVADVSLMLLGGSLKRRERLSARLGDILSQLYLASTAMKYFYDANQPESDINYICWVMQQCLYKIQIAFNELFDNFPHRFLSWFMKAIVFPFGAAYRSPNDKSHSSLLESMLSSSALRDRLTKYCYIGSDDTDPGFRLDQALATIAMVEPLWKKLQQAIKRGSIPAWHDFKDQVQAAELANVITNVEATQLITFEKLRKEIIKVNEFSFDLKEVIA